MHIEKKIIREITYHRIVQQECVGRTIYVEKNWAGFLQARAGIYKGSVDSPGKKMD